MVRSVHARRPRRGVIAVLVAVGLVALLAMTGLVVDGGFMMGERRHAQAATDSAALAGARDLLDGQNRSVQATISALQYASSQGYTNDGTTTTVTVNIPTTTGPYKDDPNMDTIEVLTRYKKPVFFIPVVTGSATAPVGARTVAGVVREQPNANSLIALSPNGSGALTLTGSGLVNAYGGGVQVNSNAPDALLIQGTASGNADYWNVVGGYATVAGRSVARGGNGNGTFSPTPTTGVAPIADPLRNFAPPSSVGLSVNSGVALTGSQSATLSPGVYVGGISASGSSSLTLSPGLYVMQGGGLTVTDFAAFYAPGVTVYNTGNPSSFGPITLTTPNAEFSAPTSGAYQGMMFYQDRQNTLNASFSDPQSGGLSGTFYFPSAGVTYNANGGGIGYLQVIADHITINTDTAGGNADITFPYNVGKLARTPQIYILE